MLPCRIGQVKVQEKIKSHGFSQAGLKVWRKVEDCQKYASHASAQVDQHWWNQWKNSYHPVSRLWAQECFESCRTSQSGNLVREGEAQLGEILEISETSCWNPYPGVGIEKCQTDSE